MRRHETGYKDMSVALLQNMPDKHRRGQPLESRIHAVSAVRLLCGEAGIDSPTNDAAPDNDIESSSLPLLAHVYGEGPLLLSDIPQSCRSNSNGVVLGIDEAGRGSVVGPMIYGMAFWHPSEELAGKIPKDFNDSKQLTEAQRHVLLEKILETPEIGFGVRVLPASEISRNMLRSVPYNLNQMSHDAAIGLIRSLVDAKVGIQTCYIDTVGNPASYRRRLEQEFPGIEFIVESKADDNYAPCSAASIVAKVVRDRMIANWSFSEAELKDTPTNFGSGYPSDPVCQTWMNEHWNPVFGFADVVRFSWAPTKKLLQAHTAATVTFAADDHDDDGEQTGDESARHQIRLGKKRQQEQMSAFLSGATKQKRLPYFEHKKLHSVTKLPL